MASANSASSGARLASTSGWPAPGRDKFVHKIQAFGRDLYGHRGDAREVATGRLRLRTRPLRTGSPLSVNIIGVSFVAAIAALVVSSLPSGLTKRASARDRASTSCRYPYLLAHELLCFSLGGGRPVKPAAG
jgi:hypothetical protein